jgi:4-hydroxy-tetrahydrodipicolinate synthase
MIVNEKVDVAGELRDRLEGGLIPAVPVPFKSDRTVHCAAQESYLQYMAGQPVAGVAVWAHTGRGLHLDDETAAQVLRQWRACLPDKVIIAGAGSRQFESPDDATGETIRMAERAAKGGADALLAYAPTWLRNHPQRDSEIIKHHARLAQVGLPLILFYLYEEAGGISYSAEVLDQLLSLPEVAGIKMATLNSVMTYQDVSRQIAASHPEKLLITGEDRFLGYSLQRGARAALIGMGAICCRMQAELVRASLGGESERFLQLSRQVDLLAESTFIAPMEGYIKRLLWALVHLGVIPGEAAHDPWGPQLPEGEFDEIGRTLDLLGKDIR